MIWRKAPKDPGALICLSYSHSGMERGEIYSYTFRRTDSGRTRVSVSLYAGRKEFEKKLSGDVMDRLQRIVQEGEIWKWDGFRESDHRVLDGTSFTLWLTFADGRTVQAQGSNAFPKGYGEFCDALVPILREIKTMWMKMT